MKKIYLLIILISLAFSTVFADDEASNTPVVRSSSYGRVYARSVPAEDYGSKGKTKVYRVGDETDKMISEYNWYASEIYLGGPGDKTIVRFGPWQRGRESRYDHLAFGIYRDGKTVKEYSTKEMEELGSGISKSVSHYTIFKRNLGFKEDGNKYLFEIEGESGKIFTIDLKTGSMINEQVTETVPESSLAEMIVVFKKKVSMKKAVNILTKQNYMYRKGMDSSRGKVYFYKTGPKFIVQVKRNKIREFKEDLQSSKKIHEIYEADWDIIKD